MTAYDAIHPARRSFSYQGQDLFVLSVLRGQRNGFFLDSGASDGLHGSNTRLLEVDYGWDGICVEPNQKLFTALARNRSCVCLDCCLFDREGDVEFFEAASVYGGILDAYDPRHLSYARSMTPPTTAATTPTPTTTKLARTPRSVLRECGAPAVIDYWSLDTEGSEEAILAAFPFEEFHVRVITVEHNHTEARRRLHDVLHRHGYVLVQPLGIDDGYVHRDDWSGPVQSAWRSAAWRRRRLP